MEPEPFRLGFRILTGADLDAALDDLAALRIAVFRDWPYLYDGDLDYERRYMASYRDSRDTILVGAFDGERLVGAATGTPMEGHAGDFAAAFAGTGYDLADIFYRAESVLLPGYRGQGAGHAFFDATAPSAPSSGPGTTCCAPPITARWTGSGAGGATARSKA